MATSSTIRSKSTESLVDNLISEKHLWGSIQVKSEMWVLSQQQDVLIRLLTHKKCVSISFTLPKEDLNLIHSCRPNSSTCLSVRFNPDGKAYGVALADGLANVYLSETDRLIYTVNNCKRNRIHHYSATSIRFRPWGIENLNQNSLVLVTCNTKKIKADSSEGVIRIEVIYFLTVTNGKVKTFHFPTGECVNTLREEREVITSDYSPRGDTFATAGDDGKLIIYDDETRARLVTYEPP